MTVVVFIILYFSIYFLYFRIINNATKIFILPIKNEVVTNPNFGNNIKGNAKDPTNPPM